MSNSRARDILEALKNKRLSPEEARRLLSVEQDLAGNPPTSTRPAASSSFRRLVIERPSTLDDLHIEDFEPTDPRPDEVQIAVRAFSLNFGDLLCVKGLYPTMPDYPFTAGFEVSGVVWRVGRDVRSFAPGQEVIGLMGKRLGGHSTLVTVAEDFVVHKPATVTHEEACAFPIVFITAHHVFDKARLEPREKVLIQTATGGVGLLAVQLAQQAGAEIFATAGSAAKLDYLEGLGVRHCINYLEDDFVQVIRERTGGYGVDMVLNTLSGDGIQRGLDLLAPGGRYFEIAVTGLAASRPLDLSRLVANQTFTSVDLRRYYFAHPDRTRAVLEHMRRALEQGAVRSTVSHVFPFDRLVDAYRNMEDRGNIGKIVVTVPPDLIRASPAAPSPQARRHTAEPIAVIGVAGRFPDAPSAGKFWENLRDGHSSIREVPRERWNIADFFDPNPNAHGKTYCSRGAFLDDVDAFDPLFFNLSGREAELADPQQRIFLQECWHALEDAGYAGDSIAGARCGVYAGVSASDYYLILRDANLANQAHALLGNDCSILPARISYLLDLTGPSIAINTACSSSLVALHLACESIRSGECDLALAGGVFIQVTPDFYVMASKAGMLSPDGKCFTFDARANGFVPGEVASVVLLKSLSDAQRDGDHIYGVIRGSSINQDGRTNGITAPSSLAQTAVERAAYEQAGVDPETIGLIEAHGTGTRLGDPVEIEALTRTFREKTSKRQFCAIGSVKTNIGHAIAAAGVAGFVKALFALYHKQIPPSLNFETENPFLQLEQTPFRVADRLQDWSAPENGPRRAAISSFGFSGTNAHLLLEEAPPRPAAAPDQDAHLLLLSAATQEALSALCENLATWAESSPEPVPSLREIAFTLHVGRRHLGERLALIVTSLAELSQELRVHLRGEASTAVLAAPDLPPLGHAEVNEWTERMNVAPLPGSADPGQRYEALSAVGALYLRGLTPPTAHLHPVPQPRRVPLPTYPFARERYWGDAPAAAAPSVPVPEAAADQPLLRLMPASSDTLRRFHVDVSGLEFLVRDHRVDGQSVLAAALALELARQAGTTATNRVTSIRDMTWWRPLIGTPATSRQPVELALRADAASGQQRIELSQDGQMCISGILDPNTSLAPQPTLALDHIRARCPHTLSAEACYRRFAELGFQYGPGFQTLEGLVHGDDEVLATLQLPADFAGTAAQLLLNPALLDGALQATIGLMATGDARSVPYTIERVELHAPLPARCHVVARRLPAAGGSGRDLPRFDLHLVDERGAVLVYLRGLTVVPTGPQVRTASAPAAAPAPAAVSIRYRDTWRALPTTPAHVPPAGSLLVLDLDPQRAANWRAPHATETVVACAGARFQSLAAQRFDLDPLEPADYDRLFAALPALPTQIVIAWEHSADAGEPDQRVAHGFTASLLLCQALLRAKPASPVELLFVAPLIGGDLLPEHAALEGLARTLGIEDPTLRLCVIGLPTDASLHRAWSALAQMPRPLPALLRWRDGEWSTRALEPLADHAPGDAPLRDGSVVVITGGAGALGLHVAGHLAKCGAQVVLLGRSAPTPAQQSSMRALGERVTYRQCDISDRDDLDRTMTYVRAQLGPLHGLIHAAGVVHDSLVRTKTLAKAEQVLAPKVRGTRLLDELTRHDPLRIVVLFSSIAGTFGNVGQADYAYANRFLDAFAQHRDTLRRRGERSGDTVSIAWPLWSHGGMQPSDYVVDQLRATLGIDPLSTEAGLGALDFALGAPAPYLMLATGDRDTFHRAVSMSSPAAREPSPARRPEPAPDAEPHEPDQASRARVLDYLKRVLADELRVPAARIRTAEPLETYGMDSMLALRLTERLEHDIGDLPKTLFFEHQRLDELADYFLQEHAAVLDRLLGVPSTPDEITAPFTPAAPPAPTAPPRPAAVPISAPERQPASPSSSARTDTIAIIGLAGRYPLAENLDAFWHNLANGRDCIREIPADRWSLDGFFDPERGTPGRSYSKWGGFLDNVDCFDPLFFNIAPREAAMIDPQERLFLQTAWHTIEDAGYTRATLSPFRTGVFVGVMYGQYQLVAAEPTEDGRSGVTSYASIANRVSYFLNLHGPSIALDTMCSSSLTAVHLACQAIRDGDCDVALAGGVNLTLHPQKYLQLSYTQFLSSDGRCRSFGEGGDGYVPGEGVGAVLLKPLEAALADGDRVLAIVRSSAINHGGKTNGYTVPNPKAQADVIRRALERGRVRHPDEVSYIEAHGTGTSLGDPIEVAALNQAYRNPEGSASSCALGSVKSTIGHLESAAGIAGLTKIILQLQHRQLAPSLHATPANPAVPLQGSRFAVQRELAPWPAPENGAPRIAALSSFGAGGSNGHLIVSEWRQPAEPSALPMPAGGSRDELFVLSAKTPERLRVVAARLARALRVPTAVGGGELREALGILVAKLVGVEPSEVLDDDDLFECGLDPIGLAQLATDINERFSLDWDGRTALERPTLRGLTSELLPHAAAGAADAPRFADVVYTLQVGREALEERFAVIAASLEVLCAQLDLLARDEPTDPGTTFRGNTRAPAATAALLDSEDGEAYLETLLANRRLTALAALWVDGHQLDWQRLHRDTQVRRIALPGYPFATERYWLDTPRQPAAAAPARRDLPARVEDSAPEIRDQPAGELASPSVAGAPAADQLGSIEEQMTEMAERILELPAGRLDPYDNLFDFGFDSITVKQLTDLVQSRFHVELSATVLYEHVSIHALAEYLLSANPLLDSVAATDTAPAAAPAEHPAGRPDTRPASSTPSVSSTPEASMDPIAIIGISGRFPQSESADALWDHLRNQRDLITEVPPERWDWRALDRDDLPPERRCPYRWGGFLPGFDQFDPLFFGLSPLEAEVMDPQHRLLLQTVWEAFEDAGYRASDFAGQPVGVFAGIQFSDYRDLLAEAAVLTAQSGLGNEHCIALNRISYLLDFRGPSETVNTACSSALVAVHRAVRSLRSGESSLAIAGGVSLNLSPNSTVGAGLMGILSPDGRCKTLDESANGYVKGEGVGIVLLKRLSEAQADGDRIYAVIRGTATNHGGRAASLTAPNPKAQADLIVTAVEEAAVAPESIGYIELHGTGTSLGDPIEINGLKQAFGRLYERSESTAPTTPTCGIGSVKTNIGHLEPAAGIAGMFKLILALKHRTLPGMLHLDHLNPLVELEDSPFYIVHETLHWEAMTDASGTPLPRRAGVSSFGFGGVNAHVILEEAPPPAARPTPPRRPYLYVLSAKTATSLRAAAGRLAAFLEDTECRPCDVAYTLQVGREAWLERLACVAEDLPAFRAALLRFAAEGKQGPGLWTGRAPRGRPGLARWAASPRGDSTDLESLAHHWLAGGPVDWEPGFTGITPQRTQLPTYAFDSKRYWFTPSETSTSRAVPAPSVSAPTETPAPALRSAAPSADVIREELRRIIAEKLRMEPSDIDINTGLGEYGVDSILSSMIMQLVQERFGGQLSVNALLEHPTIRDLGQYIADELLQPGAVPAAPEAPRVQTRVASSPVFPPELVPINTRGDHQISFWLHGATGYSTPFKALSSALGPDYPLYVFQARGTDGASIPMEFDEMIAHYIACMRMVQSKGPYFLGGYSFGGLLAIEMARQLAAQGEVIRHLVLFDTYPATKWVNDRFYSDYDYDFLKLYLANALIGAQYDPSRIITRSDLEGVPARVQIGHLAKIAKARSNLLISANDIFNYIRGGLLCSDYAEEFYLVHNPEPYSASEVLYLKAQKGFIGEDNFMKWPHVDILQDYDSIGIWQNLITSTMRVVPVPSDHFTILEMPALPIATSHIRNLLDAPLPTGVK